MKVQPKAPEMYAIQYESRPVLRDGDPLGRENYRDVLRFAAEYGAAGEDLGVGRLLIRSVNQTAELRIGEWLVVRRAAPGQLRNPGDWLFTAHSDADFRASFEEQSRPDEMTLYTLNAMERERAERVELLRRPNTVECTTDVTITALKDYDTETGWREIPLAEPVVAEAGQVVQYSFDDGVPHVRVIG